MTTYEPWPPVGSETYDATDGAFAAVHRQAEFTGEHKLSAIYGIVGDKYATCTCSVRVEGPTNEAVTAEFEAHLGALAKTPGLAKARRALADTIRKGKPT